MSTLDKPTPSQLEGGLSKDLTYQKPGNTTFALNALRDSHTGGKFEYQSEPGNELVESIPSGFIFAGEIYGEENGRYIFATDNTNVGTIATFKEGKYTEVVRANFSWKAAHPITGEYRVKNGCERIIYWCNGDSPDGWFNFDKPNEFKDSGGNWSVNKFKLVPDIQVPNIDLIQVNDSGGILPLGSYYFQVEILDKALNSIYKTDISPQVVIYDDSSTDQYNNIDGGLNIAQYSAEIGGVPLTNKSITLAFSNLDTQFPYLRVNVIRSIGANGATDAHAIGSLIAINDTAIKWTYKGYDVTSGDYPLDVSETLTDNVRYDTSYVMEQVQSRLLRGAIKQDTADYSTYQRFASAIRTRFTTKLVAMNSTDVVGNPKNALTYWEGCTFQGDEVYALGVRYLLPSGLYTPTFHIPGRISTGADNDLLGIVSNSTVTIDPATQVWESDVEHLSLAVSEVVERWKVHNTASIGLGDTYGEMGYYETDTNYPDIRDCDDVLIWGSDYGDNPITINTKIRHHRFPDRRLIPHITGTTGELIQPIGVAFDNVAYPPNIIGHQFCYVKRTEFNKTVVDSGWFAKTYDDIHDGFNPTNTIFPYQAFSVDDLAGTTNMLTGQFGNYFSGDLTFNHVLHNSDYIKLNTIYQDKRLGIADQTYTTANSSSHGDLRIRLGLMEYIDSAISSRENYKVLKQLFAPANSYTLSNVDFPNISNLNYLSPANVIKVGYDIEPFSDELPTDPGVETKTKLAYTYKKRNVQPYGDLFNLDYTYLHLNYNVGDDIGQNTLYGADCLISLSAYATSIYPPVGSAENPGGTSTIIFDGTSYNFMYEEREINSSLRYAGLLPATTYNKQDGDTKWLLDKIADQPSLNKYLLKSSKFLEESYAFNSDYNVNRIQQNKSVLPITYNYCSDCLGNFYSYIVFSPKSFDEESFDLYRINKANDYISLPAHRGKITGLKYQNNLLMVHCEDTTFLLQPNPQSLATDVSTVYLTTGDFLSIPPAELHQNDIGYAGMQSKQHMCDTPYGHCWVDQRRGQVFGFDNNLEDIGIKGMGQWFKENLPSEMKNAFYQIKEYPYPQISTLDTYNNGVGVILYYDPRYKRLIITKKDYYPINFNSRGLLFGQTSFNDATKTWYYQPISGPQIIVYFSNTTAFENKSWTLSYSFEYGSWTSFHSYRPLAAFSDDSHYYTIPQSNFDVYKIYRHKPVSSYQNYYGTKYDFIVEWMTYDASTDSLDSVHYSGYTLQWDTVNKQWKQIEQTFNRGMFYNYTQSTGLVNLALINNDTNPYSNLASSNLTKYVAKTDQNYKISQLYDTSINIPVISSDWNLIKAVPGYIDILPNTPNIDLTKNQYDLGNLTDKFIISRLYFKPSVDCKKVINLLVTNESRSIR